MSNELEKLLGIKNKQPMMSVGQPADPRELIEKEKLKELKNKQPIMSVGKPEDTLELLEKEKLKELEVAASKKKLGNGKGAEKPDFLENEKAMEKLGSAASQAAQTMQAQRESQALVGGVTTGLSTAGALAAMGGTAAALAGPAGIALGAITAFEGMSSARKARKAAAEAQRKQELEQKRARELELLEKNQARRQQAIRMLMGAF